MPKTVCVVMSLLFPLAMGLEGQAGTPHLSFEVASVKAVTPPADRRFTIGSHFGQDGINFSYVTLRSCIASAYDIEPYRIIGPDWINDKMYSIVAKSSAPGTRVQLLAMLQSLLEDRFKLKLHHEMKDFPVYALLIAKGGSKIRTAEDSSNPGLRPDGGGWMARHVSMSQLAVFLSGGLVGLDRPVLDMTGLSGYFDFRLDYASIPGRSAAELETLQNDTAVLPSIFTAVRDQLGLSLSARKGSIDVLVIDDVTQKPVEN
jgi:uncharacterized protein (TIGR03435 family)